MGSEGLTALRGTRGLSEPEDRTEPAGEVLLRLESLHERLQERYEHVAGAAFAHEVP